MIAISIMTSTTNTVQTLLLNTEAQLLVLEHVSTTVAQDAVTLTTTKRLLLDI